MYGIYDGGTVIAQFAAPMSVLSNTPIFASDTLSLKRYVTRRPAQRWEVQTNLVPLSDGAQNLMVNMVTKGYSENIFIVTPQNYGVIKTRTATNIITATGSIDSSSITISDPGGLIPKGTFINFSGLNKVYMTTEDISGPGAVGIYPSLLNALSSTIMLYLDNVIMKCLLDSDQAIGMVYTDGILMDPGSIKLVEDL